MGDTNHLLVFFNIYKLYFRETFYIFIIMAGGQKLRSIIFYKEYFSEFFVKQKSKVKDKIIWTFELIENLQRVPETYLKHIENADGLFEIRVQQGSDIYRIFCFLIKGN